MVDMLAKILKMIACISKQPAQVLQ